MCVTGYAQNVGIGTTTPGGKLQINHRATVARPSVVIYDSSIVSAGLVNFLNSSGSKYWQLSAVINNASRNSQYLDLQTDSSTILTLRGNGRVGINNIFPVYSLDVAGDANITGALRLNGSAGNSGQVLTSNGTGDPQWKNNVFSNNTRFRVKFFETEGTPPSATYVGGFLPITETIYNLDPANINIVSGDLIINKTGLYHFEGDYQSGLNYTTGITPVSAPEVTADFRIIGPPPSTRILAKNQAMRKYYSASGQHTYIYTQAFGFDAYVVAGTSLSFFSRAYFWNGTIASSFQSVEISGYLISE